MPFNRPKFSEINQRVKNDIELRLETGPLLRRSFLGYLADSFSAATHGLHGHLQWNYRQLFPDTADAENLARWASIWGINRKSATFATGSVTFTGVDGTSIPIGTVILRGDGQRYTTTASAVISSAAAVVPVSAISAGEDQNTNASVKLTTESIISGIDSEVTVGSGGITGGLNDEQDDTLRERLLERIKNPPHGGSEYDYRFWALQVSGVTRAFVVPQWDGVGSVAVYVVDDNSATAPIPDSEVVTAAQTYLDTQRPVTADVSVFAPTAKNLNLTISIDPDNASVRSAVEKNLQDLITRKAVPGGSILISQIREAVSQAAGENDNSVTVPNADFTTAAGEIAVIGTISWT